MKKRLRKKKNVKEFKVWGAPIAIKRTITTDLDSFLDDFLEKAVETNGCYFGGGGKEDHLEGFIELGCTSDLPESRLEKISEWLEKRTDVEKYVTGKVTDAWYGPFDKLDSI